MGTRRLATCGHGLQRSSNNSENLGVGRVFELVADERVEGVPVRVDDVAADRPEIAEDERRADDRVQLGGIGVEVDDLRHEQ